METEESLVVAVAQPPKFSRYRTVRKAAAATTPTQSADEIPKTPSRYHAQGTRLKPVPDNTGPETNGSSRLLPSKPGLPGVLSTPATHDRIPRDAFDAFGQKATTRAAMPQGPGQRSKPVLRDAKTSDEPPTVKSTKTAVALDDVRHRLNNPAQQEAFDILTGEAERQKKLRQKQVEDERAHRVAAKERELARQVEAERERTRKLKEEQERAEEVEEEQARAQQAKREHELARKAEKKKAAAQESWQPLQGQSRRLPTLRRKDLPRDRTRSSAADSQDQSHHTGRHAREQKRERTPPQNTCPATRRDDAVAPKVLPVASTGYDAPKSAVNAGTRTVCVKHKKRSVPLPVTLESTPKELIVAAQEQLGIDVEAGQSMLVESFEQLGLERPLRWYEHVRDVLNSWDQDHQNRLLLELSSSGTSDADLGVEDAPSEQPGDTSVHIYHSQKPGTWDKRWVTLRADGQVLVAKANGTESKNICHMSDFDVYFPTDRQAKRLKPPKRHCFAIKSQQKSAMFLNTGNFVHFFATKDRDVANAWYKAVQGWRSWYLVHEMGLGDKQPATQSAALTSSHSRTESIDKPLRHPKVSKSTMFSGLDAFTPLAPLCGFLGQDEPLAHAADSAQPTTSSTPPRPLLSSALRPIPSSPPKAFSNRGGPPVSYPKKLVKEHKAGSSSTGPRDRSESKSSIVQGPPPSNAEQPFAATGLLGRTYSQRQRAWEMEQTPNTQDLGPVHPNVPGIKPLIDLTPQPQELPQHARKGHGVPLDSVTPGGLVEAATNQDQPLGAPAAAIWHRASDEVQRSGTVRKASMDQRRSPEDQAFTGGGLLACSSEGQGGRRGRGVQCGDRDAREPMLDVTEASKYVPGSLLADVERYLGDDSAPVIDREKRAEVTIKTGEGRPT